MGKFIKENCLVNIKKVFCIFKEKNSEHNYYKKTQVYFSSIKVDFYLIKQILKILKKESGCIATLDLFGVAMWSAFIRIRVVMRPCLFGYNGVTTLFLLWMIIKKISTYFFKKKIIKRCEKFSVKMYYVLFSFESVSRV